MSENLTKDDLATQEMIAMMDTQTDPEPKVSTERPSADNTEELNSLLDTLENGSEDDEDTEAATSAEPTSNVMPEAELPELEVTLENSNEPPQESEPEEPKETEVTTELSSIDEPLPELEETNEVEEAQEQTSMSEEGLPEIEESALEETEADPEVTEETNATTTQSSTLSATDIMTALDELEAALSLHRETKALADEVKNSTQEATALAIEAARIAQEKTTSLQDEISATYQAAERARKLLEESDIEIAEIPQYSESELPELLKTIHEKNEALKKQNEALKTLLK